MKYWQLYMANSLSVSMTSPSVAAVDSELETSVMTGSGDLTDPPVGLVDSLFLSTSSMMVDELLGAVAHTSSGINPSDSDKGARSIFKLSPRLTGPNLWINCRM